MDDDDKASKRAWKKLHRVRLTESSAVWRKPCFLFLASITAGLAGQATAIIRDGDDDEAEEALDLSAPTSSMGHGRFKPPLYFSKGIFAEVGQNVTSVLLHFLPEK